MYSVDTQQYPTYALGVADIHLRSSMTLPANKPLLITKIPNSPIASEPSVIEPIDSTNVTMSILVQLEVEPPFLEQLIQKKPKGTTF